MKLQKAIKILESYQRWRLGRIENLIYTPKSITLALDTVLFEVKQSKTQRK